MQKSPLIAGFSLSVMVLGWPVGATIGVRGFRRFGVRAVLRAGGALVPVGASVFVVLGADSSPVAAGLGSLIVGLGMGLLSSSSIILIQEIVDWSERGSVTASFLFARNLGSNVRRDDLRQRSQSRACAFRGRRRRDVGSASATAGAGFRATVGDATLRAALEQSLHLTFVAMFAVALLGRGDGVSRAESRVHRAAGACRVDTLRPPLPPAFPRPRRRASWPGKTSPRANGTSRSRFRRSRSERRRGRRAARARCR